MLGRTAQNLFWMSRYIERAENMARMLEVGYRMSLTSRREGGASDRNNRITETLSESYNFY